MCQDVGIDPGRGHIFVAGQRLNSPDVGPSLQQVGRETVSAGMGTDSSLDALLPDGGFDRLGDALGSM